MRALCGAIITAGALIGLGLTAVGFGNRYHGGFPNLDKDNHIQHLKWGDIDPVLTLVLVLLILATLVGFGIAFLGLAYHHHRRHHELLHHHHTNTTPERTGV